MGFGEAEKNLPVGTRDPYKSHITNPIILLEIFPLPGIMIVNAQIITIIAQLVEAKDVQSQKQIFN